GPPQPIRMHGSGERRLHTPNRRRETQIPITEPMDPNQSSPNILSLPFIEALYADYLRDASAVPETWRRYFDQIQEANGFAANPRLSPSFPRRRLYGKPVSTSDGNGAAAAIAKAPEAAAPAPSHDFARTAVALFRSFRARGHLAAQVDPLGAPRPMPRDLEHAYFGFTEADLDRLVNDRIIGDAQATLLQALARLRT